MRVVKWIDENGAIKTSVTCMPPNAKSIGDSSTVDSGNSAANAKANASVANDTFYPTFEAHTTSVNEDNLHEVAKTFHFREFGNGAANGGTGATWADASMLDGTAYDVSYCMDDGLTSLSADDFKKNTSHESMIGDGSGDTAYITYIGTGVSVIGDEYETSMIHVAQNLPYGTHILKVVRESDETTTYHIDGISIYNSSGTKRAEFKEITFFQPKKPPIPEDACVLADYMVFADFKPQTVNGTQYISKGVRRQNISRDVFFDETDDSSGFSFNVATNTASGFNIALANNADSDITCKYRIPSFGTNYVHRGYQSDTRTKLFIGDVDNDSSATKNNTNDAVDGSFAHLTSDLTLGVYQFGANAALNNNANTEAFDIVTPIHTSHHYQSFETPYLHELIGGDRSMEQTNLICSSDGKSWDEVTRDMSYMGSLSFLAVMDDANTSSTATVKHNKYRGTYNDNSRAYHNKDFAIARDRFICLRTGVYTLYRVHRHSGYSSIIKINNVEVANADAVDSDTTVIQITLALKKDDVVLFNGGNGTNEGYNYSQIMRAN